MSDPLEAALAASSRALDEALMQARSELATLDQRRAELIELIGHAEDTLRSLRSSDRPEKPLTLHEAICQVLAEQTNQWMTVREIAEQVNSRRLYRKKDGSAIEPSQIHARAKNYDQLFEKDGPNVRMRPETSERLESM